MAAAGTKRTPISRRRATRALMTLLAAVLLIAALCLWIVTRSWFLVARLQPMLERRLGGAVEIETVTYQGAGRLAITGLTLSSHDHEGTPAEVVRIGRALIIVDVVDLLRGRITVDGVDLDDVRLRLSEDAKESGSFTFMSLRPDWVDDEARGETIIGLPPYIIINGALIEVGVHEEDRFQVKGRRWVKGAMAPMMGHEGWMGFSLMEVNATGRRPDEPGMVLQGTWNVTTNKYLSQIEGVELNEDAYGMCPALARLWWDQAELAGRVSKATIAWDPESALSIAFEVENVAMTLPIRDQTFWARYRDGRATASDAWPRMHVTSGLIRFSRDSIHLEDLVGELRSSEKDGAVAAVPYELSLAMPELPVLDWNRRDEWLQSVVAEAPFEMSVRLDDLSLMRDESGETPAVDLPLAVAQFLERFQITDWALSAEFDLVRGDDTDGIESSGEAYIHQANGAFHAFPYQLEQIEAYVQFDRDRITLHQLDAVGANGAPLSVVGEIAPPGPNAGVHLRLQAEDVPVDERLRAALRPGQARLYDVLLHEASAASLDAAGLLAGAATIDSARAELDALRRGSNGRDGEPGPDTAAARRRRAQQLRNIVEAGPFTLGGVIDLDLRIDRDPGPGHRAVTQGRIDVKRAGLLFDRFPYPVTFVGGSLDWRPDRITIQGAAGQPGAPLLAPGGGRGYLSGVIDLPREDGQVRPRMDLHLVVDDDAMTPALLAAIPPSRADRDDERFTTAWPGAVLSRGARTVEGIGLAGPLSYQGALRTGDDDRIAFTFDVDLVEGTAHPTGRLADAIGAKGLHWPETWRFHDVNGRLRVGNDSIELISIVGHHEAGNVEADGVIDLTDVAGGTALDVAFRDVEIGEYLVDLVPPERSEQARDLWERYRPRGRLDATLTYRSSPEEADSRLDVEVIPQSVGIEVDGTPMVVLWNDGRIVLGEGRTLLQDLDLDIETGSSYDGRLQLTGHVLGTNDEDRTWRVVGSWTGGQFSCPLISHLMRRLSSPQQLQRFRTLDPGGLFDGEFLYSSSGISGAGPDHFTFHPRTLSLELDESPIFIDFEEGSRFTFSNQLISLDSIAGAHRAGRFELEGIIDLADGVDAQLDLGFVGRIRSRQFDAIAPDTVTDSLAAIEFDDGLETTIEDSRLRFKIPPAGAGEEVDPIIEFDGTVLTRGASFDCGVPFKDVDGAFEITARHGPDRDPVLEMRATNARCTVFDQTLVGATATLRLDPVRSAIIVDDVRGRLHDGVVAARAVAGVDDNRDWSCSVDVAGVALAALISSGRGGEGVPDAVDGPRGQCFAGITVAGEHGDDASRRGRGMVRIIGGLADVPLVLRLTQVMQFTLPIGDRLEYGEVDFFLTGQQLNFERILLEGVVGDMAFLQLLGTGTMQLDGFELDTRFRSRGGVAVVRDVMGGLGDQIYQIQVTGPLNDPKASLVPLPGLSGTPRARSSAPPGPVAAVPGH